VTEGFLLKEKTLLLFIFIGNEFFPDGDSWTVRIRAEAEVFLLSSFYFDGPRAGIV
jgi:hypothetical protein